MKYKIYIITNLNILNETEREMYEIKTTYRSVLEEVEPDWGFDNEFDSLESAYKYIEDNSDKFKYRELTILPYILR